ncbi:isochorismatase family protein [Aneurinibacillus sp. Ricciae_BoGa-3]|uniref:isochorismatase family protein n=1 Tax=Aneurinibacillus sp. Ricciae_BoGa-3 TaxID=3022697 RepID=UPI0023404543|nr:isochorismatase family protein [Aneurinibacillus sp. Ricciae_BoGa-3]WCK53426.1 isochorismatase family protein [Aneurinibacillus sp. Ricciae_BoGa-3]
MYENLLNISEAAKLLGVSPSTLRRLEKNGVIEGYGLKVMYTPGGQRRYILDELHQLYSDQGFSGQIGFGKKPALLIRDLTIAFTESHSQLAIKMEDQLSATKQLVEEALLHKIPIIFSITVYDSTNEVSKLWCQKFPSLQILDPQSTWVNIHPALNHYSYDIVNHTVHITDLYNQEVDDFLKERQIDTVILAGATTSGSIRANAVDALQRGYRVIVPKEAVGDRNQTWQNSTLIDLNARYADVLSLEKVIKGMVSQTDD